MHVTSNLIGQCSLLPWQNLNEMKCKWNFFGRRPCVSLLELSASARLLRPWPHSNEWGGCILSHRAKVGLIISRSWVTISRNLDISVIKLLIILIWGKFLKIWTHRMKETTVLFSSIAVFYLSASSGSIERVVAEQHSSQWARKTSCTISDFGWLWWKSPFLY